MPVFYDFAFIFTIFFVFFDRKMVSVLTIFVETQKVDSKV